MTNTELTEINSENINTIRVKATPFILRDLSRFLSNVSKALDVTKEDILQQIGLAKPKYSLEKRKQALEFSNLSEQEQLKHKDYQELQSIIDDFNRLNFLINPVQLGFKLAMIFNDEMKDDGSIGALFTQFLDLLSKATEQKQEVLLNSDYTILAELAIRIIIKPSEDWNESFLLKKILGSLKNPFQS